jgi:hypothetical protein
MSTFCGTVKRDFCFKIAPSFQNRALSILTIKTHLTG